ncbi:MAG: DUF378 domain-containing protein [Gammaproteobacteria bacterium]|nr:DUF378 domain-containing protein [Gammaproteobacteria bacterium]
MPNAKLLSLIALIIVLIAGINTGLYGLFRFDLIGTIIGTGFLQRLFYIIVGVSAGYLIYLKIMKKEPLN